MVKDKDGADLSGHYEVTVTLRVSYRNKRSDYQVRSTWHCTKVNLGFKETAYWRQDCIVGQVIAFCVQNWLISIRNFDWNF